MAKKNSTLTLNAEFFDALSDHQKRGFYRCDGGRSYKRI